MKGLEVITQPSATKPTYREYQKFLRTYNGNKEDQTPNLSTSSSTSSVPSSVVSETDNAPVAFNQYLQNYGSKRYNTVKPNLSKKNVKTELFIQVNEDCEIPRKFNTLKSRKPPGKVVLNRQNSLNKYAAPLSPAAHQLILSPPIAKNDVVPDEMIYAKTAVLSELCNNPPKLSKIENGASSQIQPPPPPPKLPDFLIATPRSVQNNFSQNRNGRRTPDLIDSCVPSGKILNEERTPPLPPPPPKFLTQQKKKTLDVEPVTTTYVPVTDNTANVDKKDPNVKKLVYNTYRGLLGAYNNKANTMVTMPRNTVVQDQGVSKQVESIELQGCLDKLNGRVNPSAENE